MERRHDKGQGDAFTYQEIFENLIVAISGTLNEKVRMIHVLIEQIREVIKQTEAAALDIGNRFMNIAERARSQAKRAYNTFDKFNKPEIEELKKEADSLAADISSIVVSLQFQDITRQRLEHVIEPLNYLKAEIELIIKRIKDINGRVYNGSEGLELLERTYTIESEREVFRKIIKEKGGNGHE